MESRTISRNPPRRVAFFGGSFDPPHRGHLAIAAAAADRLKLDQVLFAPAGIQPLKIGGTWASFEDRLRMVELACVEDARFVASAIDAPRADGKPNFTIDTLRELRGRLDPQDELFCLVGADAFRDLSQWREPDALLRICEWIVVSRPGVELPHLSGDSAGRVHLLDNVWEDVSATEIRRSMQSGGPAQEDLPPAVEQFIRAHHLYEAM